MKQYGSEIKLTAVHSIETQPVLIKQERAIRAGEGLSRISFGSIVFLLVSTLVLAKARKVFREENVTSNRSQPLPCKHCHFFTDNQFLRCSVQPSSVLTEQALDCLDYRPLSKKQQPVKQKR